MVARVRDSEKKLKIIVSIYSAFIVKEYKTTLKICKHIYKPLQPTFVLAL
jgi:hypothetical protein